VSRDGCGERPSSLVIVNNIYTLLTSQNPAELTRELTLFRPKWIQLLISAPKSRRRYIDRQARAASDRAQPETRASEQQN
jgi:hypothetical protein